MIDVKLKAKALIITRYGHDSRVQKKLLTRYEVLSQGPIKIIGKITLAFFKKLILFFLIIFMIATVTFAVSLFNTKINRLMTNTSQGIESVPEISQGTKYSSKKVKQLTKSDLQQYLNYATNTGQSLITERPKRTLTALKNRVLVKPTSYLSVPKTNARIGITNEKNPTHLANFVIETNKGQVSVLFYQRFIDKNGLNNLSELTNSKNPWTKGRVFVKRKETIYQYKVNGQKSVGLGNLTESSAFPKTSNDILLVGIDKKGQCQVTELKLEKIIKKKDQTFSITNIF